MAGIFSFVRKNAGWYMLSMVLTGLTSFAAIIITKRLFTSELFIAYNLKFNGVFMLSSICVTWLSISILRMYHNLKSFFQVDNLCIMGAVTALLLAFPLFTGWFFLTKVAGSLVLPLMLLGITIIHAILLVTHQAKSNAKVVAQAEGVRGAVIILFLLIPFITNLKVGEAFFWLSWIAAYLVGLFMLFRKHENSFFFPARQSVYATWVIYKPMLMQVIKYGFPLTIWMFFSFLLTYADRVYISRGAFTLDIASDYIALADAISRGCGFLFIPLNISVYPVISKIFDEGDKAGTRILIVKVLKMQALLVLATAIGLVVASPIIANLLRLSSPGWLHNAMLILALLSIYALWQSCAMIQKPMELSMKTGWLAILVLLSVLLVYLLVFVVVKPQNPFALIACLATGIITYATINVWLLVKFLKANPG